MVPHSYYGGDSCRHPGKGTISSRPCAWEQSNCRTESCGPGHDRVHPAHRHGRNCKYPCPMRFVELRCCSLPRYFPIAFEETMNRTLRAALACTFAAATMATFAIAPASAQDTKVKEPESVFFEPNIEFANPDGQHLQLDMARPQG